MRNVLFSLLLAVGCWQCKSKEEPTPAPAPQSRTELLTGKEWRLTAATVNPIYDHFGRYITDWYSVTGPCLVDDLYRFDLPDVLTITEGSRVCQNVPIDNPHKWAFNSDETTLTRFDRQFDRSQTFIIESLSADKLIMTRAMMVAGDTYTLRFVYIKQ